MQGLINLTRKRVVIAISLFIISFFICDATENVLIIRNGTIIYPGKSLKKDQYVKGKTIVIEGDKISGIYSNFDISSIKKPVKIVDAKDKYIIPGLIDGFGAINNQSYANAYLYMGVTSIVAVDGGRRGPFFGSGDPSPGLYRLESVGDDRKSTEEHIKDLRALYARGYKVILLKYELRPDQVKACVAEARRLGMVTIGELGYTTYREGCSLGVNAFVHTTRYSLDIAPRKMAYAVADHPFSDDLNSAKWKYYKYLSLLKPDNRELNENSKVLGNCKAYIMPTMSLSYLDTKGHKNLWNEPIASILNEKDINNPADRITGDHRYRTDIQNAYSSLIKNEKMIEHLNYKNGAKYLTGSAADVWGTMPGISLHTELKFLKDIGLSNREVILAATENFNKAFGWKIGRLQRFFSADILILNSDPLENLKNLTDIYMLILKGNEVDREKLIADKKVSDGLVAESYDYYPVEEGKLNSTVKGKNGMLKKEFEYLSSVVFKKIRYFSDGLKVTAYISYPKKKGKYPSVIYNRGGNREFGRITPKKVALIMGKLAAEGYVVIGSQYRGNDGGEGIEEFGGRDVNDIINLITLLKNFVYADSKSIGLYGWSRGGMMTYLTLKKTGIFKAAVIGGGLADLKMMMDDRPDMEKYVYAELIPGYYKRKEVAVFNRSAINWVQQLPKNTPLLLLHGTADWRVSPLQSLEMAKKMQMNRIPYRLVMFEGGDHGLTEFKEDVDDMVKYWFDKYLKKGDPLPVLKPHGR